METAIFTSHMPPRGLRKTRRPMRIFGRPRRQPPRTRQLEEKCRAADTHSAPAMRAEAEQTLAFSRILARTMQAMTYAGATVGGSHLARHRRQAGFDTHSQDDIDFMRIVHAGSSRLVARFARHRFSRRYKEVPRLQPRRPMLAIGVLASRPLLLKSIGA